MPNIALGSGNTIVSEIDKCPSPMEYTFSLKKTGSKEIDIQSLPMWLHLIFCLNLLFTYRHLFLKEIITLL